MPSRSTPHQPSPRGWMAYAVAFALLLGAIVALAWGFQTDATGPTYLSIAMSVVSAVLVVGGVLRSGRDG